MIKPFIPQLVYFEPDALQYPLGQELKENLNKWGLKFAIRLRTIK